jgi:hypothetical protein
MQAEELNAKAIIAAALIGSREIDVTVHVKTPGDAWTKYDGLRRLHLLTNLIYDAISDTGERV